MSVRVPGGFNPASVAITGGNVAYALAVPALPVISLSSGTMGNNGALSAITALGRTYGKCYVYLPIGAIATGVPAAAGFYYAEMSSTTAGTVYNNTYSGTGVPFAPASKTAFVTTGPGAFAGNTAEVGISITILPNAQGLNGVLIPRVSFAYTNSAGAKQLRFKYGATTFISTGPTTALMYEVRGWIQNQGAANSQYSEFDTGTTSLAISSAASSVDSSVQQSAIATVQPATATDNAVIEAFALYVQQNTQ